MKQKKRCNCCGRNTEFKTRINYRHGVKQKGVVTKRCNECGGLIG